MLGWTRISPHRPYLRERWGGAGVGGEGGQNPQDV